MVALDAGRVDSDSLSFSDFGSLEDFKAHFRDETACIQALFQAKWPTGFRCPRCSYSRYYTIRRRRLPLFECCACGHQTSLTVGTLFEKSRTPLVLWFQTIYLHTQNDGISALNLMHIIATTYKTAWLMCHKIRHAMMQSDAEIRLGGLVKVNVAQYGRPYNPTIYRHPGEHPILVGASLRQDDSIAYLKIKQVPKEHLYEDRIIPLGRDAFIHEHVDERRSTISSEIKKLSPNRDRRLVSIGRQASRWINDVFCGIGAKHIQAYLDQFCYLFNKNNSFHPLLARCAKTSAFTYSMLTGKPSDGVPPRSIVAIYPQLKRFPSYSIGV